MSVPVMCLLLTALVSSAMVFVLKVVKSSNMAGHLLVKSMARYSSTFAVCFTVCRVLQGASACVFRAGKPSGFPEGQNVARPGSVRYAALRCGSNHQGDAGLFLQPQPSNF